MGIIVVFVLLFGALYAAAFAAGTPLWIIAITATLTLVAALTNSS
jgi:hypothetical protein